MGAELPGAIANRGLMNWLLQLDGFFYLYQVQCFCFSTVDEFKPIADPLNFTHIGQQQTFKFFKFLSFLKREKRSRDVSTHSVISAEKVKDMILILTTFFERRTKNPEITFMAGKKVFVVTQAFEVSIQIRGLPPPTRLFRTKLKSRLSLKGNLLGPYWLWLYPCIYSSKRIKQHYNGVVVHVAITSA